MFDLSQLKFCLNIHSQSLSPPPPTPTRPHIHKPLRLGLFCFILLLFFRKQCVTFMWKKEKKSKLLILVWFIRRVTLKVFKYSELKGLASQPFMSSFLWSSPELPHPLSANQPFVPHHSLHVSSIVLLVFMNSWTATLALSNLVSHSWFLTCRNRNQLHRERSGE